MYGYDVLMLDTGNSFASVFVLVNRLGSTQATLLHRVSVAVLRWLWFAAGHHHFITNVFRCQVVLLSCTFDTVVRSVLIGTHLLHSLNG